MANCVKILCFGNAIVILAIDSLVKVHIAVIVLVWPTS